MRIADQPAGNLGSHTDEAIIGRFQKTVREEGVAWVLTTHKLARADRCDRILHLADGKIDG